MYYQLSKYGLTGFIGTVAHYIVMYLLMLVWISPVLATFVGATVGALVNFTGCRQWVFRESKRTMDTEAIRFGIVSVLSLLANTMLVWSLSDVFGVWSAQLVATLLCFLIGFLINRQWTFSTASDNLR